MPPVPTTDMTTASPRPVRSDATRNRAAIVAAATAAFAESGHTVDVRAIAERAGVGMGTLYRHFPKKDELLETVLREQFLAWAVAAARAAARHDDPWDALVAFLDDALTRQAHHLAMCEHLAAAMATPDPRCATDLLPLIDDLVARCHRQNRLAAGVTAQDVALLLAGLGQAVRIAGPDQPERWHRLLELTLHGIAPQARTGSVETPPSSSPRCEP